MVGEVFKILHKLSPEYLQELVNFTISPYNFREENLVSVLPIDSAWYGLRSFRYMWEAVRIYCGILSVVLQAVA